MNIEAIKNVRFKVFDTPVKFIINNYQKGNSLALQLITDDEMQEPYATLTVNFPGAALNDDEIIVKTWSENEAVAAAALGTGLFEDTGKRIEAGFVVAEVWRIKP